MITDDMLCTGLGEPHYPDISITGDPGEGTVPSPCHGDSGGPLITGTGSSARLAGVVSWAWGCGFPGQYAVYGKVSYVADWIDEVTR
jgi:secreted trypsin-like serine protease